MPESFKQRAKNRIHSLHLNSAMKVWTLSRTRCAQFLSILPKYDKISIFAILLTFQCSNIEKTNNRYTDRADMPVIICAFIPLRHFHCNIHTGLFTDGIQNKKFHEEVDLSLLKISCETPFRIKSNDLLGVCEVGAFGQSLVQVFHFFNEARVTCDLSARVHYGI